MRYARASSMGLRNLAVGLCALSGLCVFEPAHAQLFPPYLTGSVGISARPAGMTSGPHVDSTTEVRVNKWNGELDASASIHGSHLIHQSGSEFEPTVAEEQINGMGQYFGFVRTHADPGTCYRAKLFAFSPGAEQISRGSAEQCFEDSCPILLDLDRNGFRLVGTDGGVSFDLDADGAPERLGWTAAGALDGFLCRDLNGNGTIDDGRELFGTATLLEGGELAENGYLALAELDQVPQGGNGDGRVSEADALFPELCVWFDFDHDGRAGHGEVTGLQDLGVLELVLDYRTSWRRDRFGNLFRFGSSGTLEISGTAVRVQSYDVFFATRAPERGPD